MGAGIIHSTQRFYCSTSSTSETTTVAAAENKPPFHLCIIGSGPAGLYTANRVYKKLPDANITILEKLPVPYGLIRYGIAPDHQNEKKVKNTLEKTITDHPSNCRFVGNVNIEKDITFDDIQSKFHAIVLACGIEGEKKLGVPGEQSNHIYSARDFVSWLNGHPDYQKKEFLLQNEDVVIVGQGNVALDVARMLLKPTDELSSTDITSPALEKIANSKVKNINIVGRRGPAQVAFTTKEVREILKLPNINAYVNDPSTLKFTEDELNKMDRAQRKIVDLFINHLKPVSEKKDEEGKKNLIFHFLRSPTEFNNNSVDNNVSSIMLGRNKLVDDGKGSVKAESIKGDSEQLKCGTVFRSIGYTGTKFQQVPFDFKKVCIPNRHGKVLHEDDKQGVIKGLYVSGWIKSGPTGTIVNVSMDTEETAQSIKEDYDNNLYNHKVDGYQGIIDILHQKQHSLITFDDWKKIEQEEFKRGKEKGKIIEKIIVFDELKNIIKDD
ncbi:adrenodoxin reductase [Cavenderia fasciculata]|uniref:NADPH:adrenodoxin oxidoreductase, mitochondrial n=1 Tax=Cavenderia fasciculata TaxID=261658 RepID=F4PWN6_CACFS|nr:adrenodoxin reductase [Cavenderia fasciculata]EGG20400.1 adrenodoxin reductase [Cavenderia fasciculata]|eukprot:XP_004367383.1 adrenodoxin reductase [Cavenderia fasciculata]